MPVQHRGKCGQIIHGQSLAMGQHCKINVVFLEHAWLDYGTIKFKVFSMKQQDNGSVM